MWKYQVVVTCLKIKNRLNSTQRWRCMIETSSVHPWKSSATFGNLRQSSAIFGNLRQSSAIFGKCSKNVRRRFSSLRNNSGRASEIFGKWSEIFGKSSKTSLLACLYNKQNNTWTLGDMEFNFSCSHSISQSFAALTRSISMWTLEDKFHISARPCIILYLWSNAFSDFGPVGRKKEKKRTKKMEKDLELRGPVPEHNIRGSWKLQGVVTKSAKRQQRKEKSIPLLEIKREQGKTENL